jgi:predicted nucleic acid-binding protein
MSRRTEPTGVVLDCVVFLQAVANDKAAARIFDLLDEGRITIFVSRATLAEARYVLYRADLRARIQTLNDKL